jgi:arylsulfatase A-like enzyme
MIVELDDSVGELIAMLEEAGMWDTTMLAVVTDNGGMVRFQEDNVTHMPTLEASAGSNFPLRVSARDSTLPLLSAGGRADPSGHAPTAQGAKTTLFEGGTRATAFISGGPRVIPQAARGTRFGGLMHGVDLTGTLLAAGGAVVGTDVAARIDGIDHRHALFSSSELRRSSLREHVPINILNMDERAVLDGGASRPSRTSRHCALPPILASAPP